MWRNVSEKPCGILNPFCTFDSFVVGAGNRSAHAAAQSVAGSIGAVYNPLFIYGEGGLGKTHLLGAIGNHIQAQNKRAKVIVSSPLAFMKETMDGTHSAKLDKYYAMIRNADVLLMDDFQEMAGEISIRKEFLHTVELLHERQTPIVITSDRMPGDIPELDARLLSRIDDGILEVIQPPYFMLRRHHDNHHEWHRKN
jgi:chromosomal replication initiator protein